MTNPFFKDSTLKNQAPHFNSYTSEHFLPAIEEGIRRTKESYDEIKNNPEAPTFENTFVAMEDADSLLGDTSSVFYHLLSVRSNDDMEELAEKIGPLMSELSSDIAFDPKIFARVKTIYDDRASQDYTEEQLKIIEDSYKGFVRSGALLDEEKQEELRKISSRLSVLSPEFSKHMKKTMAEYKFVVEKEEDLKGLPQNAIDSAAQDAKNRGHEGQWVFTLDIPSLLPVLTFLDNRDIRETIWRAFNSRCWGGDYDNSNILMETATLKHKKAQILGYKSHAAFILEKRMAENVETVTEFLAQLKTAYKPAAEKDLEELKAFAKNEHGLDDIKPWDISYYSEKLSQKLFDFSAEDLRPYFELNPTLEGTFKHYSQLFNIRFDQVDHYETWHDDVKAYDVFDNQTNEFVATFFVDLHPREGKRPGAWENSLRSQGLYKGKIERPVTLIVGNMTKPTEDTPALLTHDEFITVLHEMGHALHDMLSQVTYRSVSGTSVEWDFVEFPSQLMENWGFEHEFLKGFAKHYKTGEPIPDDLVKKLNTAKNFHTGMFGLRQITLGTIDMAWHSADPSHVTDPAEFEDEATKDLRLFPRLAGPTSTSFGHIFAGGYSAGYYSYKWSEFHDADGFKPFKQKGLYDRETANKLVESVLSKGGTKKGKQLYRDYRGRDATIDAMLEREGLASDDKIKKSA